MTYSAFDILVMLLVCGLANQQVVETFRHGSIFDGWMHARYLDSISETARRPRMRFGQLWACGFCLSHWTACWLVAGWFWWPAAGIPLAGWLAVVRLSQMTNDLMHDRSRSPARAWEAEDVQPETEGVVDVSPDSPDRAAILEQHDSIFSSK